MAIFRYEKKIVVRSPKGRNGKPTGKRQSTLEKAAYAARERLRDEQTKEVFDFSHRRADLADKGIELPDNAPAWMRDRQQLWNAVERAEKRRDSQLGYLYILTIPRGVPMQRVGEYMKDWAAPWTDRGYAVDWSCHDDIARDGDEQGHVHVLVTTRPVDPKSPTGFGLKPSMDGKFNKRGKVGILAKAALVDERVAWERLMNRALDENGSAERIDHRSLKERGINREPQPKLGPAAAAMERKGQRTRAGDAFQVVKAVNTTLAWEDAETDDSGAGRRRRAENRAVALRIARGSTPDPSPEPPSDSTPPGKPRASTWQERERERRERDKRREPER